MGDFHTIKSGIVQDTLYCLAQTPLDKSYIGGGISLQLTLPEDFHRITSDIDITVSQIVSPATFREYADSSLDPLKKRGYTVAVQKNRNTLDCHIERDDDRLIVQLPRRGSANFVQRQSILEREVEHARKVPYQDLTLCVIAYEDLVAHKLLRSTTFQEKYILELPEIKELTAMKEEIDERKDQFDRQRFTASPEEAARALADIRLHADIYDMRAVFTFFNSYFSELYLEEALSTFEGDSNRQIKWKRLLEVVQK